MDTITGSGFSIVIGRLFLHWDACGLFAGIKNTKYQAAHTLQGWAFG